MMTEIKQHQFRSSDKMDRRRALGLIVSFGAATILASRAAYGGSAKKNLLGLAMRRILRKDAARDAATKAQPLRKPRSVWRYTTQEKAKKSLRRGLPAGSHMTSGTKPGRPPKGTTAQRRYGLPNKPDVRLRIELPKGHPVRHNKVLGGKPGMGEITSPVPLPPNAIHGVTPIK